MRFPWKYVAVATASYSCMYFVCRKWLAKEKTPEFSNRMVTLGHGVSAIGLTAYCCFKLGPFPFTELDAPLTPIQAAVLASSLGYFLFDFYWCVHHNSESNLVLAHHIVSIGTLARALQSGRNGSEHVAGLGLLEFTNPLLQARWFLRTLGYHNQTTFIIVEWAFIVQFTLIRIVFGTYMLPRVLKLPESTREYVYEYIAMYIISGAFFVGMLHFVWRKYIKRRTATNEDEIPSSHLPRDSIID